VTAQPAAPQPTAAQLNAAALTALGQGDASRAVPLLEAATAADPAGLPLWLNLAAARRMLADTPGERAALKRALEVDQRDLTANLRLAELHEREGERAQAALRWGGVLMIAGQLPNRTPALESALAHAQAYLADYNTGYARAIDTALAPVRETADAAELRRFDACVAAATGRRRIYTNNCEGVHFPFLPADEFFERKHFPWLANLEAATPAIRAEFEALIASGGEGISPYVEMAPGTPRNIWSELDGKLDWGAFFLWKFGDRIEENIARTPETARTLSQLPLAEMPRRAPTAFFSILKPGTRLPPHTGVSNLRAICHLALVVPPGCGFRVGGEVREWREGEAFVFDDTIEHEAWNDSNRLRAVLIFDVWNPHLTPRERTLMQDYFRIADSSGYDPAVSRVSD